LCQARLHLPSELHLREKRGGKFKNFKDFNGDNKYTLDNYFKIICYWHKGTFNTTVDIKLKQWAEAQLGLKCVEVGWETLKDQFMNLMDKSKKSKDHDDIFDNLKSNVIDEAMHRHLWEDKGAEMLRVIQLNTLEDRSVHDKQQWDSAIQFLEKSLQEKLTVSEANLRDQVEFFLSIYRYTV
jgi:hypothetical protein